MTAGPPGDVPGVNGSVRAPDEASDLAAKTQELAVADGPKKRKKRRPKKSLPPPAPVSVVSVADNSPRIARFKHTKYISCYHVSGPWLQLPLELLQTLLLVNSGPTAQPGELSDGMSGRRRLRAQTDEEALRDQIYEYEDQVPPPVDPRCFRTVVKVRELVEDALDLVLRATTGLGATAFDTGRKPGAILNTRQHRLRSMAVAKLARAYALDEVATSVVVMQSGSSLDDVADRVLKVEPENLAAHYVGHFHDKIPGRAYASSTTTETFDYLISRDPTAPEYYRSKGICQSQKQDFLGAIESFTRGLALVRSRAGRRQENGAREDGHHLSATDGALVHTGAANAGPGHNETTPEEDMERQLIFNRGMSAIHAAHAQIEEAVGSLEGRAVPEGGLPNEMGELPLSAFGIDVDPVDGLYRGHKRELYERRLGEQKLIDRVRALLRKARADHEDFLSTFRIWEAPSGSVFEAERQERPHRPHDQMLAFRGRRLCHHRALSGRTRYGDPRTHTRRPPALLTSYHPLQIESHFALLLCHVLSGSFAALLPLHYRAERLMDYLESYPAFLVSRSQCQSEYVEIMERLAQTWLLGQERGDVGNDHDERDIALSGNHHSLAHLVSFFTPEYDQVLDTAVDDAFAKKKRSSHHNEPAHTAPNGGAKQAETDDPPGTTAKSATAKSEIAVAWLRAAILPRLGHGSADKGKRKAIAAPQESALGQASASTSGKSREI